MAIVVICVKKSHDILSGISRLECLVKVSMFQIYKNVEACTQYHENKECSIEDSTEIYTSEQNLVPAPEYYDPNESSTYMDNSSQ